VEVDMRTQSFTWRVKVDIWDRLPEGERNACSTIVEEYGGRLGANGAGAFRLYRAAEMCAASLARRGRIETVVELLPSESDLLGEQVRGDC
jgi:hypothetical protein